MYLSFIYYGKEQIWEHFLCIYIWIHLYLMSGHLQDMKMTNKKKTCEWEWYK
jgi:hypothetical protein